ncbi:MAG: hypothetical protein WAU69_10895 [Solirubrobacteraceae bacterium]
MRYIVVDLNGASRLSFRSLSEARDWSYALSKQDPGRLGELLIEHFNNEGQIVGESQWADEFLSDLQESTVAAPSPFALATSGPVRLKTEGLEAALSVAFDQALRASPQGAWSGMAASTPYASSHLHEGATDTPDPLQAETVAGSARMGPVAAF